MEAGKKSKAIAEGLNELALVACPRMWATIEARVDRVAIARGGLAAATLLLPVGQPVLTCLEEASATPDWDAALTERLRGAARALFERIDPSFAEKVPCVIHGADCPSLPTTAA